MSPKWEKSLTADEVLVVNDALHRFEGVLSHPERVANQCRIVSQDLVRPETGTPTLDDARLVWLVGHRSPVAIERPGAGIRDEAEHMVVLLRETILLDLTRRQYDPCSPVPLVYAPLEAAGVHWKSVILSEDLEAEPMVLPPWFVSV
jgi:hypothetical protein